MSLQKEFFMTEPFNPSPYFDNTIVNLSGAAKFEADTVFKPGIYRVDVQAGGWYSTAVSPAESYSGGRVLQEITVNQPFVIRAYSGSKATWLGSTITHGTNPYDGSFKVNAYAYTGVPPLVTHIFGNAASASTSYNGVAAAGGGNCLGNGALPSEPSYGTAAGSCLHFLPIGGVFGTDYLFAFHTTGSAGYAATGSAYGGAASGTASNGSSSDGGSTPFGSGGAGVTNTFGKDGSGVGHGNARNTGASAWFDGVVWRDSDSLGVPGADGHIIVKYLGPIN